MALLLRKSIITKFHPLSAWYGRLTKNGENCTVLAIEEYPNWFTAQPPRWDFVLICFLISAYLFLGLAVVCDGFCVPAVEKLRNQWHLPYDVTGATLMAGATSAPEFFIHLYATIITKSDMGIGTIMGSAVFNGLAIIGLCGLVAGAGIQLDWWPISRDILWYIFAIAALTAFIYDGRIEWWEATTLIILFVVNTFSLFLDRKLQRAWRKPGRKCVCPCFRPKGEVFDLLDHEVDEDENGEPPFNFCRCPKEGGCCAIFLWILSYPWECIFFLTVPNCKRKLTRKCALLCFLLSIGWIAILTYLLSWMITVIGFNIFVPDSVMGITFLAAGTSIPEMISSYIVARKGYGSMAVCNAIGSNSVDILFCLATPWLIRSLTNYHDPEVNFVDFNSKALYQSTGILFVCILVLYLIFMINRFHLNITLGIFCMSMFICYVVFASLIELNVFFEVNLPNCPLSDQ
uniref:Sodium/calcium exchanger membrane region domain-containing protein n=1 Tax=Glossina brevipalpis TaxID=37001 RepID=A0A1A9W8U1_9MUSC